MPRRRAVRCFSTLNALSVFPLPPTLQRSMHFRTAARLTTKACARDHFVQLETAPPPPPLSVSLLPILARPPALRLPRHHAPGKDLNLRKLEEEARLERLQEEQAEIKQQSQEILLSAEDRTTNRMMVEYERRLHNAEKRQEGERKNFEHAKKLVQPVRYGLQELHRKCGTALDAAAGGERLLRGPTPRNFVVLPQLQFRS